MKIRYDDNYPTFEYLYPRLVSLAKINEGIILDIGCGNCPLLSIKNRKYTVICLDKTLEMIKKANGKGEGHLILGEAEQLPFRSNFFDAVISNNLLYWLNSIEKAVEEMTRVVKPGKVIIGTTLDPLLLKKMESAMLKSSLTKVVNKKAIFNESFPCDLSFGYVIGIKPI